MGGGRGRYRGVTVDGYLTAEVLGTVQAAKGTVVPGTLATLNREAARGGRPAPGDGGGSLYLADGPAAAVLNLTEC
jgi:hypothetical protein